MGITIYPLDYDAARGPGVLICDEFARPLCDFVREVSHNGLERVLAIATSHAVVNNGDIWSLLRAGASDVFVWGCSNDPAREMATRLQRWHLVDQLVESPIVKGNLIGQSPAWIFAMRQVVEVARFTDASVLIMGESGTGKELAARLIHTLDPRPSKCDIVVVDCTNIVPALAGSEFFGHERGAFTGAVASRDGAFALANGGTLFLDEVGELPLELQAQLLRVVQERTYKRVGGNNWLQTDFRLVCATNKDLLQEVALGRFRSDLYYRIATWVCKMPPLRDRFEDILPLVSHFCAKFRCDDKPLELDWPVRDYLLKRQYPGNVRDLCQLVARISHRHVGPGPITVGDIIEEDRPQAENELLDWRGTAFENAIRFALSLGVGLKEIGRAAENTAVRIAVSDEKGNLQDAARKLRITDRALQMRRAARRQSEQTQHLE
jgi:transcriptional regulator with GAF, ATPase, and Fis domain